MTRLPRIFSGAAIGLLVLGLWDPALAKPPQRTPKAATKKGATKTNKAGLGKGRFEYGARVQQPQKFLERRSYMHGRSIDLKKHAAAVRYLAEHYGHVEDEATMRWNNQAARGQAKTVRFFGMPISIHAKIAPALAAVEKHLGKSCTGKQHRYRPRAIGGFRTVNTYRGGEISNHLFGIAVDIDPEQNPCCACVDPWPSNPVCRRPGPVYRRTALPKCWIKGFERFGFDWLGHDMLEDTMHFEFLGDPDRITR